MLGFLSLDLHKIFSGVLGSGNYAILSKNLINIPAITGSEKCALVANVLQNTQDLVILRFRFAEDGYEICKDI